MRKIIIRILLASLSLFFLLIPFHFAGEKSAKKVIVLGFDGADPVLARKYMDEGLMPNFKKLASEGYFQDLTVTNPPQTPVSWATFMTSWNPGRTQVFDFLKRDALTYKPSFALMGESSKPFLFGKRNPWAVPLAAALAGLLLPLLLRVLIRRGAWMGWSVAALLLAAGLGGAGVWAARYLPSRIPDPINYRKGKPFWETAADHGKKALVFRVPDTFPAEPFRHGRLLSGLGVPDMRGRVGTPYLFTTDAALTAGDNEFSVDLVALDFTQSPHFKTTIQGPFNKPFYDYAVEDALGGCTDPSAAEEIRKRMTKRLEERGVTKTVDVPLEIAWDEAAGTASYNLQGQKGILKPGQWSPWVVLEFQFNPVVKLKGLARFYLLSATPNLSLYMSPLHFHPEDHGVPISYPKDYAEKLLRRFGYYKTMGWAIDTWTISSGLCDETQFLSDMNETEDAYEKMMLSLLQDRDWDLYVQVFEFTDRVAHILWRYMDPKHPMHDAAKAKAMEDEMRKGYARMDRIVGEALAAAGKDIPVVVVSDHGFTSFARAVNTNRWLIDNGYMALKAETGVMTLEDLFDDNKLLFKNVDWSRTKVYALGLGNLYINLKGREKEGIVAPGAERDTLVAELKEKLPQMVDPQTGGKPVEAVYSREEIYREFDPAMCPDLRVTNTPGYRVSWQTSLGGAPEALIEDNMKAWSGDHCSLDPKFVPGILLANRPLREGPNMLDVAPTILDLLGMPTPKEMEGRSLAKGR
jgi:predicted AlkP superfamily phosphohydrolase/phosphomutase